MFSLNIYQNLTEFSIDIFKISTVLHGLHGVAYKDVLNIKVPTAFTSYNTLRLDNHGCFDLNDEFGLYLAASVPNFRRRR
jgi:hypothetical protein